MSEINLTELDNLDEEETEKPKRRSVKERFKGVEKVKKQLTSFQLPEPLFNAINEYCAAKGISKTQFYTDLARNKLESEGYEV